MKPNKSHIILKIFGFLIFSIGILYICQFFTKTLEEGFSKTIEGFAVPQELLPEGCQEIADAGRNIILCPTETSAETVFKNVPKNLLKKYDNVCVAASQFSSIYYTCYTRPAPKIYNDKYGIYRDADPVADEDTMPNDLLPSIDTFCASYATNTTKVNRGIVSTATYLNTINDTISNTTKYKNDIVGLKTLYCNNPIPASMTRQCNSINIAFESLNNMAAATQLSAARNAVQTSLDSLSNISTQTYSIYNGSKCQNTPGYVLSAT
jgi:hypothetical protein